MNLSLSPSELEAYVLRQLKCFFPDNQKIDKVKFRRAFSFALERTEYCFKYIKLFSKEGQPFLNHLHTDQYAMFLLFLANSIWQKNADDHTASKVFALNKCLHSLNCMYDTRIPDIFLLFHVIGTVLGKAEYADFLIVTHGCTIGAQAGKYPRIGKGVSLLPHSSIIGDCNIGDRVSVGINTTIYQQDIDPDTVVFTQEGRTCKQFCQLPWGQQFFTLQFEEEFRE
ncbi:Hypothetical protein LUCI_0730 [Lucifera butyrica]|uniref:Serine O-acetyltransferase n=1 Tax=Lucifera butyrica TaxID=1351585 RepID=A0A498R3Y2_9FIRM|nr:serine acetyltransferase [Lucifera butyrica]VBB05520.1 Hypothetical protein LUCI_0730 [Lucifera butyrica]